MFEGPWLKTSPFRPIVEKGLVVYQQITVIKNIFVLLSARSSSSQSLFVCFFLVTFNWSALAKERDGPGGERNRWGKG